MNSQRRDQGDNCLDHVGSFKARYFFVMVAVVYIVDVLQHP